MAQNSSFAIHTFVYLNACSSCLINQPFQIFVWGNCERRGQAIEVSAILYAIIGNGFGRRWCLFPLLSLVMRRHPRFGPAVNTFQNPQYRERQSKRTLEFSQSVIGWIVVIRVLELGYTFYMIRHCNLQPTLRISQIDISPQHQERQSSGPLEFSQGVIRWIAIISVLEFDIQLLNSEGIPTDGLCFFFFSLKFYVYMQPFGLWQT